MFIFKGEEYRSTRLNLNTEENKMCPFLYIYICTLNCLVVFFFFLRCISYILYFRGDRYLRSVYPHFFRVS